MARIEKGSYKYINTKKIKLLIYLLVVVSIALAIFFAGLVLNDFSKKNIFSVLAMLMVLPGAKILVSLIVVWPHKSLTESEYNVLNKKNMWNNSLLYGMVLTSPDKVMHIKALAILEDKYVVHPCLKQDIVHMKNYLKKHMYNYGYEKEVEILEDFNEFNRAIDGNFIEDKDTLKDIVNKLMILEI